MSETTDATTPTGPPTDGDESGDESSGFSPSSWEIVAGVVLLVAAVIIIVVLTSGGDDDGDQSLQPPVSQSQPAGPGGTTPGGSIPGATNRPPVTPLPESVPPAPLATDLIATDSFDRGDSDELGESDSGARWVSELGTWGIRDNAAAVIETQDRGFRNIALLDPENVYLNQGSITVTMRDVQAGSGIVFRYRDTFNYLALVAQPNARSWRIEQVAGGESTLLGTAPLVSFEGEVSVTVQLRGLNIDVYVDDKPKVSARTEELGLAGIVGLFAAGEDGPATRWDGIALGESENQLSDLPPPDDAPTSDDAPAEDAPETTEGG